MWFLPQEQSHAIELIHYLFLKNNFPTFMLM